MNYSIIKHLIALAMLVVYLAIALLWKSHS